MSHLWVKWSHDHISLLIFRLKIDGNVKFEKSIDSVKNSKLSNYPIFRNNNFISIPRIWLFDWLWNWLGVRILKWSQIDFHFWRWLIYDYGMKFKKMTKKIFKVVIILIGLHTFVTNFRLKTRLFTIKWLLLFWFLKFLGTYCALIRISRISIDESKRSKINTENLVSLISNTL